ncbi:MAG: response regulator [Saprospiraceae bacterium]|nr:response regulator [Saprospiraceae bacterium]
MTFKFTYEPQNITMDFDPDIISKIILNLAGNAVKFCASGDNIDFSIFEKDHLLTISIADTGSGIKPQEIDRIFDRFFSSIESDSTSNNSTGIGLALTKELVHFLSGDITVESTWQQGSTFKVVLPITRTAPTLRLPLHREASVNPQPTLTPAESIQILIVEDNTDLIFYIRSCLGLDFKILEARNGHEGEQMALENIPDLIISDIMIPFKNGIDLCKSLKEDERTSHIPIILLTAKATIEDRIVGLESGADAYLAKPFSERELHVRIRKLLELRRKLQEKYASNRDKALQPNEASVQPDPFMERVKKVIDKEIGNEGLNPNMLAARLFLSRTQLHRKIKAITGQSTTYLINLYRIEMAKKLLANTDETVDQVAYEVGFVNPGYFRRIFQKYTGMNASSFRENSV